MQSKAVHKKSPRGVFLLTLIIFLSPLNRVSGQISSPEADYTDSLAYPVKEGKDPFFIFYQANQVPKAGSLSATLPANGIYNFEWSQYNPELPGFDPPFQSESNLQSSTVSDLESGGYQVRIFNGSGTDTTMMAWILLDGLHAWVHKTEDGNLDPLYRDCSRLALSGFVEEDTLLYFDPVSDDKLTRPLDYRFKWTSDNEGLKIPHDSTILSPNISYSPPYEDTWYFLTVTDEVGMVEKDSVFYESIQTKAKFSVEYYDKITGEFDPELTGEFDKSMEKGSTDATLTVRYLNHSKNGARFEWVLLDTLGGIRETAVTYDTTEMPEYTYSAADKYYYPSLLSISEEGCQDSVKIEQGIYVQKSQLDIPNVFTPNGDNLHDLWVFKHQSIKNCRITVVDRTGKMIYKMKTEDIYTWEGWNGTIHDSDREAPAGQYYYVVEGLGYDGVEYVDPTIWSQMKIFGGAGVNKDGNTSGGSAPPTGSDPATGGNTLYTGWVYLYR